MKTMKDYRGMFEENVEAGREYCRAFKSDCEKLDEIRYSNSTPADTVNQFVEAVGLERAIEVIASFINQNAWDGRISNANAEWAKAQENVWDEKAMNDGFWCFTKIHLANLDQIAYSMRKYASNIH